MIDYTTCPVCGIAIDSANCDDRGNKHPDVHDDPHAPDIGGSD